MKRAEEAHKVMTEKAKLVEVEKAKERKVWLGVRLEI